jgi:hypothetical protein
MDVTLLVLVVTGDMGIWGFIEQRVEVAFKGAEPREETFQHRFHDRIPSDNRDRRQLVERLGQR